MPDLPAASELAAAEGVLTVGTVYDFALFTADPGTTGASNEVVGGSYARKPLTVVANGSSNGLVTGGTDGAQSFAGMPAVAGDLWGGIFTTGGAFVWGSPTAMVTGPVAAGATVDFAAGAITAAIS